KVRLTRAPERRRVVAEAHRSGAGNPRLSAEIARDRPGDLLAKLVRGHRRRPVEPASARVVPRVDDEQSIADEAKTPGLRLIGQRATGRLVQDGHGRFREGSGAPRLDEVPVDVQRADRELALDVL